MGEYEEWPLPSGLMLNGLLPNESGWKIRYLNGERWAKAEERTAELIACIQPNQLSENRRGAVADYVQRLIMRCFPCQVFTFGSVPLKTYLPDGDIDLTAFSKNQIVKDMWAIQVRDILESEERNENAEFRVKEVQYIQAEVKVVKCLVENIVVDISFNQLGGLCTLCFLEEVDNLISQDHLFKRSIILIKAWCYYESRILGAHHGLISTYALETLVLYIFHIFNNSFNGPLEVLFRFLEFFSNFDWENFCVSLWGPVSVGSLPDINVEPPRKDGGELLLRKDFLEACNSVYAVSPGGLENQGHPFVSKHFNVIDPLRINNNLGRSVNKGNFYRIRSAFAFGAEKLAKLLDCPKENIASVVNQFFRNTWERHGSGVRPDAPLSDFDCIPRLLNLDQLSDTHSNCSNSKESNDEAPICELDRPETGNSKLSMKSDKSQRALKHELMLNPLQSKHLFARTRSSPELTNAYCDASSQLRVIRPTERVSTQSNVSSLDEPSLGRHVVASQNLVDVASDSTSISNNYFDNSGGVPFTEDHRSVIGAQGMQQEEQDLVNMMASSSLHNFGGHFPMPLNMASPHLRRPISGYAPRGASGMFPLMNPHWPTNFQFHQGVMSSPSPRYFKRQGGDAEYWNERDLALNGVLDPDDENLGDFHEDDRQPSTSGSSNFVSSSRISSLRDDYVDSFRDQDNRVIETFTDERTSDARSKTSSESSWDGSSVRASKGAREKRGRKNKNGKNIHEYSSPRVDDENRDCSTSQTSGPNPPPGFEGAQVSGPDTVMPMVLGPDSYQRGTDNSRTGPFTFYPTGPPVPFFTMLPVYNNYPDEADNSEPSSSHLGGEDAPDNNDSSQVIDSSEPHDAPDALPEEPKRDILDSDFTRHWQNLQFGRFCQGPPVGPPSPVVGPPMYFQGRFPWDGLGRPISANGNLMSQLMSSGHRILPINPNPLQSDPSRPTAVYQQFADEMPRYCGGTGTYLPNPEAFVKDRHSSRGRRNSHKHDRTDHADREGNWNTAKSKAAGRSQKPRPENGLDRPRSAYRHQPTHYQAQNGPLRPTSSYGMYPLPGMNPGESTSNGPTMQNLVMVYPYGHNNSGYVSPGEQLEFGSLGPAGYMGPNDGSQLDSRGSYEDQRYHRSSTQLSSPDQPSSPHFQRRN